MAELALPIRRPRRACGILTLILWMRTPVAFPSQAGRQSRQFKKDISRGVPRRNALDPGRVRNAAGVHYGPVLMGTLRAGSSQDRGSADAHVLNCRVWTISLDFVWHAITRRRRGHNGLRRFIQRLPRAAATARTIRCNGRRGEQRVVDFCRRWATPGEADCSR